MAYYRNYYNHQSEYDDEQSVADSQTDLYSGYSNKFRPQRQEASDLDRLSRQTRKNHRKSSFMDPRLYYLPEYENTNNANYTHQQPSKPRPQSSYFSNETVVAPIEYKQQGRRRGSQSNKQHQTYPITPEDERNNYLYNDHSFASSAEEVANHSAAIHPDDAMYMVPGSQHSGATLDDEDDISFIEDTTTQRNTLINSETYAPVADEFHQKQTISPSVGNGVSPMQLTSPYNPSSEQQQYPGKPEALVEQPIPNAGTGNAVEKKKWFNGIVNTALILKKRAQKFKRDDRKSMFFQQQQQQQPFYVNASSPSIQVISAGNNGLLGDVLDSKQQQELITQLYQSPPPAPGSNANLLPEKTKITSLDRIWVFRLHEEANNLASSNANNIAWIGFDFENQLKIEQHIKDLESRPEDGRLALYDSHIRHKTMPVIVTPNDNKGYYFADVHQTDLITLEITFIENDHQKVTFVYRV